MSAKISLVLRGEQRSYVFFHEVPESSDHFSRSSKLFCRQHRGAFEIGAGVDVRQGVQGFRRK